MWEQELDSILEQCQLITSSSNSLSEDFISYVNKIVNAAKILLDLIKNIPIEPTAFEKYFSNLADNERAYFLHEVRKPIIAIKGYCMILGNEKLIDLQYQYLQIIHDVAKQFQDWIYETSEVFGLTIVSTGPSRLVRPVFFDIADLLNELVENISSEDKNKFLSVQLAVVGGIYRVYADNIQTKQVLLSILSMLKSLLMPGHLIVEGKPFEEDTSFVQVSVLYLGDGIDPKLYATTLHPPDRSDSKLAFRSELVSDEKLPLLLAQSLIEAQRGKFWLENEIGVKSIFCFTLPTFSYND